MMQAKRRRRVVVTGMGAVTPLGHGVEALWRGLLEGRSGVRRIEAFDASGFPTDFGGLAPEVEVDDLLGPHHRRLRKFVGRKEALGLAAAAQAVAQAGLDAAEISPDLIGVAVGTEAGRPDLFAVADSYHRHSDSPDPQALYDELDPLLAVRNGPNLLAGLLAIVHEAQGPNLTVSTACTSSAQALGEAFLKVRNGDAEVMLAGGADVLVEPFMLTGFTLLGALSTRCDDPTHASRPFDRNRDGFVLADGAGFLVLEELRHAQRRGAEPLAELVGFGSSLNAYRITDSPPDGGGAYESMLAALESAGIEPEDVDYINAHGTSTQMNDEAEAQAIRRLFGAGRMAPPPVSSCKALLGHLVAACGSVEAIACVQALREGIIPPTANLEQIDPVVDLDVVPEGPRPAALRHVLTNSFGFGGSNGSLVLKRKVGA